jgi:hypothetical protein
MQIDYLWSLILGRDSGIFRMSTNHLALEAVSVSLTMDGAWN